MKNKIELVEVGPRDGLQNEDRELSLDQRFEFVKRLVNTGIKRIEVGAFVSPKWVPQMRDSGALLKLIEPLRRDNRDIRFSVLVPNLRGLEMALESKVSEVAIFLSASESFSRKNINCTIDESIARYAEVTKLAKKNGVKVRAYLSMCFGCPFEGSVDPKKVAKLAERVVKMGCYEVSIGDTIGIAHPGQVKKLLQLLFKKLPSRKLAMHFHDTRGTALSNSLVSIQAGIRVFDSSLGGIGGCPYAPSATGNVATEDMLYMVQGLGFQTGIDIYKLIEVNKYMSGILGKKLPSRVAQAPLPREGAKSGAKK